MWAAKLSTFITILSHIRSVIIFIYWVYQPYLCVYSVRVGEHYCSLFLALSLNCLLYTSDAADE